MSAEIRGVNVGKLKIMATCFHNEYEKVWQTADTMNSLGHVMSSN